MCEPTPEGPPASRFPCATSHALGAALCREQFCKRPSLRGREHGDHGTSQGFCALAATLYAHEGGRVERVPAKRLEGFAMLAAVVGSPGGLFALRGAAL